MEIVESFRDKYPGTELHKIISEALGLWEKRTVAELSGRETKWLFDNAKKSVKGLQRH